MKALTIVRDGIFLPNNIDERESEVWGWRPSGAKAGCEPVKKGVPRERDWEGDG
jgi:hypothetical protein